MKKLVILGLIGLLGIGVRYVNAEEPQAIVIQGKETEIYVEVEEVAEIPELIQVSKVDEIIQTEYRYINGCPLDLEIQQGIFDICKEYNISYELVMSVIMQESSFRPNALGDNCESKGLMQVQAKWHKKTMEELGVTDLYDPLQNVTVGVTLLRQYFEENDDVYYVLMKYNGGHNYAKEMIKKGKVSTYAMEITERAMMYEMENGI